MLRTLSSRRWLVALTVAALFAATCVFLGRWQWHRHVAAAERAQLVEANYAAAPVPLESVYPSGGPPLPDDLRWTRVTTRGHYLPHEQVLVRNRPQNVVYGYEVLVPLRLEDGSNLLIDRGWVPNAERADVVPQVPPAPSGPVTVIGWLRQGEVEINRAPTGQLASINIAQAAEATGLPLRPAYLQLDSEIDGSGRPPARPDPLIPPDTDTGPHLAYALQWWLAAPVGFVLVLVYARREHRERTAGVAAPVRARKVRIWDEEDA